MIVFWRPPAMMIIGLNIVGGALVVGYIVLHSIFGIEEVIANSIGFILGCIGIIITDILYRRKNKRRLDDVGVSSVFWLFPTWVVGIILIIIMVVQLIRS